MHIRLVFRYFLFFRYVICSRSCWNMVSVVSSFKKGSLLIRKWIVMYFITFCFQKMYFFSKLKPYFLEVEAETIGFSTILSLCNWNKLHLRAELVWVIDNKFVLVKCFICVYFIIALLRFLQYYFAYF